jgi:hypothetical protein
MTLADLKTPSKASPFPGEAFLIILSIDFDLF